MCAQEHNVVDLNRTAFWIYASLNVARKQANERALDYEFHELASRHDFSCRSGRRCLAVSAYTFELYKLTSANYPSADRWQIILDSTLRATMSDDKGAR